jgi:hypothetical protein
MPASSACHADWNDGPFALQEMAETESGPLLILHVMGGGKFSACSLHAAFPAKWRYFVQFPANSALWHARYFQK